MLLLCVQVRSPLVLVVSLWFLAKLVPRGAGRRECGAGGRGGELVGAHTETVGGGFFIIKMLLSYIYPVGRASSCARRAARGCLHDIQQEPGGRARNSLRPPLGAYARSLEAELLEEPLVLASLERAVVLLLENLFHLLARVLPRLRVVRARNVSGDRRLQLDLQSVARRHAVGVVHHLDERLHLRKRHEGCNARGSAARRR